MGVVTEVALSFCGDVKDYEGDGEINKTISEERAYTVLEEVGTSPNVVYLSKIRNKDQEEINA